MTAGHYSSVAVNSPDISAAVVQDLASSDSGCFGDFPHHLLIHEEWETALMTQMMALVMELARPLGLTAEVVYCVPRMKCCMDLVVDTCFVIRSPCKNRPSKVLSMKHAMECVLEKRKPNLKCKILRHS